MRFVVFGLAISSSWGNGHATLWRALGKALARQGHRLSFFERDVPYYAAHRDVTTLPGGALYLYRDWGDVAAAAARELAEADVSIVTSYCPDARRAGELAAGARTLRVFYDLDTPVTLEALERGRDVPYIDPAGLGGFDLVLSYTGGRALTALQERLGARHVAPLYGCVDPEVHHPVPPDAAFRSDLSYLGTYADDRQAILERLFIEPARRLPGRKFILAGSQYPEVFPWASNIWYLSHLTPAQHPEFYCSSALTLNVTRGAMATMGYCPSGRLFEAASCGVPILSDTWEGLESFFRPGEEILVASDSEGAIAAIQTAAADRAKIARAARERTLEAHTGDRRAAELVALCEDALSGDTIEGAAPAPLVET